MPTLQLGLLRGRGRTLSRLITAVAGMLLVLALSLLQGLFGMLDAAGARADGRALGAPSESGCLVALNRFDVAGFETYERMIVAQVDDPSCTDAPVPPGLNEFPRPGEVFLSPALMQLRDTEAGVAERFPRVDGLIGRDGLVARNELRAIVGAEQSELGRDYASSTYERFGAEVDWQSSYLRTSGADLAGFGLVFCVPVAVWVIYAATLVAARVRERQFGVLSVLGVGPWALVGMLVIEAVVSVGFGALVGAALAQVLLPRLSLEFAGLTSFVGDFTPSADASAGAVATVVVLAAAVAAIAALRFVFLRFSERQGRPKGWGYAALGLWLLGTLAGVGMALSGEAREHVGLMRFGQVGTALGVAGSAYVVASFAGRRLSKSGSSLEHLVGARLRRPAGSLVRAAAIIGLALFVTLLARASDTAAVISPEAIAANLAADGRSALRVRYPSETTLALLPTETLLVGPDPAVDDPQVLYGTCSSLRAVIGDQSFPCESGAVYFESGDPVQRDRAIALAGNLEVVDEAPGPRGGEMAGVLFMPERAPAESVGLAYAAVPANEAGAVYDRIIGAQSSINVRIVGMETVTGAATGNQVADVIRWSGYFALAMGVLGSAVAVIALMYDRRNAAAYLDVLGLDRRRSWLGLAGELVAASAATSLLAVCAATTWGAAAAANTSTQRGAILPVVVIGLSTLACQAVVVLLVSTPVLRTASTAVLDGDADTLERLQPFALRRRTKNRHSVAQDSGSTAAVAESPRDCQVSL